MSTEDKQELEALRIAVEAGQNKIIRWIMTCIAGGFVSFGAAAFYIGGLSKDFNNIKEWKPEAQKDIKALSNDNIMIKTKLNIK